MRTCGIVVVLVMLALTAPVRAYSVLAHEATIDATWTRPSHRCCAPDFRA
jgi:hypothetical protein